VSGWTLAAILRRERGLTAPIVMISAHAEAQAGLDGRVAYHDDFLSKPVNIETLLTRIERHLKLTWLTERPAPTPPTRPRIDLARLDEIERLARIGHVRGIAQALDQADADDPAAAAFTAQARRLLRDIDLDGVATLAAETRRDLDTERETG
jgi:FixJ family two-component response regulator